MADRCNEMQEFLAQAYPAQRVIDSNLSQVGPTLWFYYSPRSEFGIALQKMQSLLEAIEPGVEINQLQHTDFDMVILERLELGSCHVVHGRKIQPKNVQQFKNQKCLITRCACGSFRIECDNPAVQKCCQPGQQ